MAFNVLDVNKFDTVCLKKRTQQLEKVEEDRHTTHIHIFIGTLTRRLCANDISQRYGNTVEAQGDGTQAEAEAAIWREHKKVEYHTAPPRGVTWTRKEK